MKLLLLSQLRDLLKHGLATIALLSSLALAVFSVAVVHITGQEITAQVDPTDFRQNFDYVVPLAESRESEYFQLRQAWREGRFPTIVGLMPVIEGYGDVNGRLVRVLGFDPLSHPATQISGTGETSSATFLTQNAVIAYGDWGGIESIGDTLVIDSYPAPQNLLLGDIATVQNLLDRPGELDAVWLQQHKVTTWEWLDLVSPGLMTTLGLRTPLLEIEGYEVNRMRDWNPMIEFGGSIAFNLGLLGILAIFVSAFIVFEAASSNFRRRHMEIKRLVAAGVTQAQFRFIFATEFLLIGMIGSVIGLIGAVLFFEFVPIGGLEIDLSHLDVAAAKGLIMGVCTTVFAALVGMNRTEGHSPKVNGWLSLVAITGIVVGVLPQSHLMGAILVVVSLCLLQIGGLIPSTLNGVHSLVHKLKPEQLASTMNLRSVGQQACRAFTPVSAFSIGIGAAVGIALMVASFQRDFEELLDLRFAPGLHIDQAGVISTDAINQINGVIEVREYFRGQARMEEGEIFVIATTLDDFESHRYGFKGTVAADGVFINEQLARHHNLKVGDQLNFDLTGATTISSTVLHIFQSYGIARRVAVIPENLVDKLTLVRDRALVRTQSNHHRTVLSQLTAMYPHLPLVDHVELRDQAVVTFNRTFALTRVISVIAGVVAVIGLFNFSLAQQQAKTREYRLLSTLGQTKRALLSSALIQSSTFASICCFTSLPLGVGIAWVLCELINPRAFQWTISLHLIPSALLLPVLLGFFAALLACLVPIFLQIRRYP